MLNSLHLFLARGLLAALLLGATGAALAGPVYRVAVDTSSWSGSGYLNLTLAGVARGDAVTATLSNFKGSFGSARSTQGQVSGDVGSQLRLVQGPSFNELLQAIDFGGMFSFDVGFELAPGLLDGANFGVALVNAGQTAYAAGTDGDVATIALMPGAMDAAWADQRFASIATIAEVPEPGSAALFGVGLLFAACGRMRPRARTTVAPATA